MSGAQNKLISLFCGPGGFDAGFHAAGYETLLAVDKDRPAVMTHRRNHVSADALVLDLTATWAVDFIWEQCQVRFHDEPPVGIIGGPPCQSFSVGNSHKVDDDPRHRLPLVYANIIGELNQRFRNELRFFVFENVPSIKSTASYHDFKERVQQLDFEVFEQELDAQFFGVPQARRRLFVVGINRKQHKLVGRRRSKVAFKFPAPVSEPIACGGTLRGVTREAVIANSKLDPEDVQAVSGHWNHWCMEPKSSKFRRQILDQEYQGKPYRIAEPDQNQPSSLARRMGGKSFKIIDEEKPSYAVAYGHREVHIHPNGHRRLSVYEALLLQGFSPEYRFMGTLSDQIRLVSEVVAPPVARHLAEAINQQLKLFSVPSR